MLHDTSLTNVAEECKGLCLQKLPTGCHSQLSKKGSSLLPTCSANYMWTSLSVFTVLLLFSMECLKPDDQQLAYTLGKADRQRADSAEWVRIYRSVFSALVPWTTATAHSNSIATHSLWQLHGHQPIYVLHSQSTTRAEQFFKLCFLPELAGKWFTCSCSPLSEIQPAGSHQDNDETVLLPWIQKRWHHWLLQQPRRNHDYTHKTLVSPSTTYMP